MAAAPRRSPAWSTASTPSPRLSPGSAGSSFCAIPKWALLAPIFVPLFMRLGVAPEAVMAAYRVADSPPNIVTSLMPYFALIVVFAQRYDKNAGVGRVVAMMLPYAVVVSVVWILLFLAWELLGLPYGPG